MNLIEEAEAVQAAQATLNDRRNQIVETAVKALALVENTGSNLVTYAIVAGVAGALGAVLGHLI